MKNWFNAHNYEYIETENGTYFWQTAISTGELTPDGKIIWHDKKLFNKVKKHLKKNKKEK